RHLLCCRRGSTDLHRGREKSPARRARSFRSTGPCAVPVGLDILEDAIEDNQADPRKGRTTPLRLAMTADRYLAPVTTIFAVIAVAFAGLEYIEQVNAKRVERSLAEVALWDSGGYRSTYQQLNTLIWPLFSAQAEYISSLPLQQQDLFYAN